MRVRVLEPFRAGPAYRTLTAGCSDQILPLLRRPRLEQFTGAGLMQVAQLRIVHDRFQVQ